MPGWALPSMVKQLLPKPTLLHPPAQRKQVIPPSGMPVMSLLCHRPVLVLNLDSHHYCRWLILRIMGSRKEHHILGNTFNDLYSIILSHFARPWIPVNTMTLEWYLCSLSFSARNSNIFSFQRWRYCIVCLCTNHDEAWRIFHTAGWRNLLSHSYFFRNVSTLITIMQSEMCGYYNQNSACSYLLITVLALERKDNWSNLLRTMHSLN